jgi:alcohol dehydrogenase class IV
MSLFQLPRKVFFQRDIFESLGEILQKEGIGKVLLISDENIYSLWQKRINTALSNLQFEVFTKVFPEPEVQYVEEVSSRFMGKGYDAIVAMGGGSVIDFSKSLAVKLSNPEKNLKEVNPFENLDLKIRLIAVPTTSGTGSDVSFGIVLSDNDEKLALGNYDLVPEIDILDPSLTPVDPKIIVATGIDAFVHSFEAIASNASSVFTDALAERAIETIFKNLKRATENEESAKDLMHISATMAGIAFSNSGTASAHALGHSFGATFHVTHGTSVGLFLVPSMIFNSQDEETRKKYLRICKILDVKSIEDLIAKIEEFFKSVGQPFHVREVGISKETYDSRIDDLVSLAMRDSELAFNPVIAGEEDLKKIFIENY